MNYTKSIAVLDRRRAHLRAQLALEYGSEKSASYARAEVEALEDAIECMEDAMGDLDDVEEAAE